jgi:hypothetical protein
MLCPNDMAASGTTYAILQFVFLIGLCVGLAGCAVPETSIVSKPAGATVAINGVTAGTTPIHHQFDFKQTPTFNVVASKTGYLNEELILTKESPGFQDNQLNIVLAEDEAYKVTTMSDAGNNWLRVPVDPSQPPDVVWEKIVDSVTGRYPSLEMVDAASGYARSVYSIRRFNGSNGDIEVRTRFICSISSKTPLAYKMKIESEICVSHQHWVPYDRVFKEDARLIEEIQSHLGVK